MRDRGTESGMRQDDNGNTVYVTAYPRFHPVVVGRYIGDYTNRFTCWAVADHELANRTVSQKFDSYDKAKREADRLNAAGQSTHHPSKGE